ncbi:MAG: 5-bromo-4-chloroindolyl phosphate hydrolysis family protein [Desulfobaccales bacterium]
MPGSVADIISGLSGGAVFLLLYVGWGFSLVISLVIAGLVFGGLKLIFRRPARELQIQFEDLGLTPEMVESALVEGSERVNRIRALGKQAKTDSVKKKINDICGLADSILDYIAKNPQGIKTARRFLTYYLDAVQNILNKYTELSEHGVYSDQIAEVLSKVERMLDMINQAFERQLAHLLENQVMDIDTEIQLLQQTMQSEGLLRSEAAK